MNPAEYVEAAMRTAPNSTPQCAMIGSRVTWPDKIKLLHASLGMVTEAAEFQDALKKHFIYGKVLDKTNAIEELGDILWYVALACDSLDVSMERVMDINIAKLRARFPEKFVETEAINRNLDAERAVLETH